MSAVLGAMAAKSTIDRILDAITAIGELGASPAVQQLVAMELARLNGIPQDKLAVAIAAQGHVGDPQS